MIARSISKTFTNYSENIVYSIQSTLKQNKSAVIIAIALLALCAFVATLCIIRNWRNKTCTQGLAFFKEGKFKEAFPLLLISAQRGFAEAQYKVAKCFDEGYGTKKDQKQAFFWYKQAAEQGNASAQCDLAICYEYGEGVEQDREQALVWHKKAADAGDCDAQYNLGLHFFEEGVHQDLTQALKLIKEAAEKGHDKAQNQLGEFYEKGEAGIKKDLGKAVKWFKKAVAQDYPEAKYNLGNQYCRDGDYQNIEEGLRLLTEAAKKGIYKAQNKLGNIYSAGKMVDKNPSQAIYWYNKAIAQDCTEAKYNLANFYFTDTENQDFTKAAQLFEAAANDGDSDAQYRLGECYMDGKGVEKNISKAVEYFKKAAEVDHVYALFQLGQCYENGIGVEKNLETAIGYYKQVIEEEDHKEAQEALNRLKQD